jgi:hypothetical protein
VGRPSLTKVKRFFEDFEYQAASWDKPRRVIAKIEWHPGELFPKVGFIVTNLPMEPDWVVRFYNQRGTAEQHIKEGKYAFRWTRLSCRKFRHNEVRLQLHALAYNLATFLRCIELPEAMADWSLTSLQLKLIKIGAPRRPPRPAPLPSSWPRSPSPARWCGPSLPPSAVFERLRHAHDHDPCPS